MRNPDAYTDSVDVDYLYLYYRKCTLEVRIKERQNRIVKNLRTLTCHLSKEYLLNLLSIRGGVLIYAVHCIVASGDLSKNFTRKLIFLVANATVLFAVWSPVM